MPDMLFSLLRTQPEPPILQRLKGKATGYSSIFYHTRQIKAGSL
jgi:hypothetical protein